MSFPLPTYRGFPVLDWRPDWSAPSPDLSFHQDKTRWDNGVGRIRDDSPFQPAPRTERRIRYVFRNRARTIEAEDFILRTCQGRLQPFWISTWTQDVKLTAPCADDEDALLITPFGYGRFLAGLGHSRSHIALWPSSSPGTVVYREIVDHEIQLDGTEKLTLDDVLGFDLAVKDPVTFLLLCRVDSDLIILEWQHTGGVSILELPVIDLPWETP